MSKIRKIVTYVEDIRSEAEIVSDNPLKKVVVAAVIKNPFAGQYVEDLSELVNDSENLAEILASEGKKLLDGHVESYGKAAIVGTKGEQEHGNAYLTTVFGNALRKEVGGGKAWISSVTKKGCTGCSIDIPLAYKDALYVRSHYDSVNFTISDAPLEDEIVVIVAMSNRGRLNARCGGLSKEEATKGDGLC